MAWFDGLEKNSAAYRFASDNSKIIRVVAGPGTGKSFGLQRRVARLLEEGQDPKKILAVTFTRTAAQDLKNEISSVGVDGSDKVIAKTLHSFCLGLLNKKNIIEKTGRYPRPLLDFEQKPMLYDLSTEYGNINDKQEKLDAFEAAWARLQSEEPGFARNEDDRKFEHDILKWLKSHKAMLFGEMITETYHYLRNNPMCIERQSFDHILIDEYQDLNKAEQAVIDLLASNCQLSIIGDDDQSIYSFKHAHPEGIRDFPKNHPECGSINFDQCRRCPKKVVSMASRLISKNTNRTLGDLNVFDENQDGEVKIVQWKSLEEEILGLSKKIYSDIDKKIINPEDILVLSPSKKIGYRIRDILVEKGVNAKSYFRESAIRSDGLKYSFSLLTYMSNPNDMVALRYLLGYKGTNYRTKSYTHLVKYANDHNMTTTEVLEKCVAGNLSVAYTTSLVSQYKNVIQQIQQIKNTINNDESALIDILAPVTPDNNDFRTILSEAIAETEREDEDSLESWLKKIHSLVIERVSFPENTSSRDHVRIMSLHASKGLSAKYVVVMSAIDDLIPYTRSKNGDISDKQIEEQRRLFYVAITRCKSSKDGHPGTLIISSFVGLPGNEAAQLNIQANAYEWKHTSASRFIRDFGETAPASICPS